MTGIRFSISGKRRRFLIAATVATAALMAGLLQPVAAPAVADTGAPDAPLPIRDLPPIVSPDEPQPVSEIPAGDFTDISTDAEVQEARPDVVPPVLETPGPVAGDEGFDPATSKVVSEDAITEKYLNADGSHTLKVADEPINVRMANGAWADISTTVKSKMLGRAGVDQNPLKPDFAAKANDPALFTVTAGKYSVGYALEGAAASARTSQRDLMGSAQPDGVLYPSVFPGVDLTYNVDNGAVKELLILKNLPSTEASSWSWRVTAPGLTLSRDDFGGVKFTNPDGVTVFSIPAAALWDSSGVKGESEPALTNAALDFTPSGDQWLITITPDRAWLADPARIYPIYVDPTMQASADLLTGYKSDGATAGGDTRIGNSRDSNTNKFWRTVLRFPFSSLAGKQIIGATLAVSGFGASGTQTGSVRWANCYGYTCTGEYLNSLSVSTFGQTDNGLMGQRYAEWVRDQNNWGASLMITGEETSNSYTYKQLTTTLFLTYKDYPSITNVLAPSPTNGIRSSLTPTVQVSGVNGYDSVDDLQYLYRFSENGDPESAILFDSPWVFGGPYTVPANILQPGKTYYWKSYIRDRFNGTFGILDVRPGPVHTFTTNTPAPTPPQSSASIPDESTISNLTPTLSASPVSDVNGDTVKYQFRVATGADGKSGAVVSSGWITSPIWQVPAGTLQDGGAYSWVVLTDDGYDKPEASWVGNFRVDLRIGASGPSPTDTAGPVTVNLANGNVNLGFASPTVSTVGGPMGMSFSYNSLLSPTQYRGLTGSYYVANPPGSTVPLDSFDTKLPALVRTDPSVSFNWGTLEPGPGVPVDNFLARWTGYIQVPTAGSYTFGLAADDRARTFINGATAVDRWSANANGPTVWGSAISLGANPVSFQTDFQEGGGGASLALWVRTPSGQEFVVPSDWFTTKFLTLPSGWSASTPISGSTG